MKNLFISSIISIMPIISQINKTINKEPATFIVVPTANYKISEWGNGINSHKSGSESHPLKIYDFTKYRKTWDDFVKRFSQITLADSDNAYVYVMGQHYNFNDWEPSISKNNISEHYDSNKIINTKDIGKLDINNPYGTSNKPSLFVDIYRQVASAK